MEYIGLWKVKACIAADESGVRLMSAEEIASLPDDEDSEDYKKLLRSDIHISEQALDMYYHPTAEEMPLVEEEGWELTEKGILLDSYPAKIENGVLLLNYERDGAEYFPIRQDGEGCLVISDGTMIIQKA